MSLREPGVYNFGDYESYGPLTLTIKRAATGLYNIKASKAFMKYGIHIANQRMAGKGIKFMNAKGSLKKKVELIRIGTILELIVGFLTGLGFNYDLYAKGDGKVDIRFLNPLDRIITIDTKCHGKRQGTPYLYADPEHGDPFLTHARIQASYLGHGNFVVWGGQTRTTFDKIAYMKKFPNYWPRPAIRCKEFKDEHAKKHGTHCQVLRLDELMELLWHLDEPMPEDLPKRPQSKGMVSPIIAEIPPN